MSFGVDLKWYRNDSIITQQCFLLSHFWWLQKKALSSHSWVAFRLIPQSHFWSFSSHFNYRSIQIDCRQTFFRGTLRSNCRYRIVLPEQLFSITYTDLWKCLQKISDCGCRFSLEFQSVIHYRYKLRARNEIILYYPLIQNDYRQENYFRIIFGGSTGKSCKSPRGYFWGGSYRTGAHTGDYFWGIILGGSTGKSCNSPGAITWKNVYRIILVIISP